MNASQTVTSTHRSAFGGLALVAFAGVASARGALLQLYVRPGEVFRHPTNQVVQRNSRHEDEDHRAREQKMNRDEQKLIARLTAILNSSIENGLAARLLFPVGAKADTVPRALVNGPLAAV